MLARASRISHPSTLLLTRQPWLAPLMWTSLLISELMDLLGWLNCVVGKSFQDQVIPRPLWVTVSPLWHFCMSLTKQCLLSVSECHNKSSEVPIYISIFQLSFTSSTYINITVLRDWYLSNVPLIPVILLSWPSRNTWNGFSCQKVHIQKTNAASVHVIPELKTFSSLRRDFWTNKPSFWALTQEWCLNEKVMPCWNNSNIK